MPKAPLFTTLLLLCLSQLSAQTKQTVTLLNAETTTPIQGAFFAYDTLQFGVSDDLGNFTFQLRKEILTLRISHLSYRDTVLFIAPGSPETVLLSLQPESIILPEISVSDRSGRKFRDPTHLLKLTLRAVPDNYVLTQSYQIGYYQEEITYADCPVSLADGVFEYRLSAYTDKHVHRKAWKKAWDRFYSSYSRPFNGNMALSFDHVEGTVITSSVDDAYRPIRTRYSNLQPPLQSYHVFSDGPLEMVALDKVRLGYDFLSRSDLRKYTYTLIDSVFANGVFCYQIHFAPSDSAPSQYHGLNKTAKTASFSGDIFISMEDLAIVRYEAYNSKTIVRNYTISGNQAARIAPLNSLRIKVDYARNKEKKWQLKYVRSKTTSPTDSAYEAVRSLYLTTSSITTTATKNQRWYGANFLNHIHNLTYRYDSLFWADFAQSSIYQAVKQLDEKSCAEKDVNFNFSHELTQNRVSIPKASPRGNLSYVKPVQQKRKDWEWLESPSDSATLAYLRWENDYYARYFFKQRPILDDVAAQFSSAVQGISVATTTATYPDTTLKSGTQGLGFYQIDDGNNEHLLAEINKPPKGYVITNAKWSQTGKYFYSIANNRAYDGLLSIYNSANAITTLDRVEDCQWQGDTLYVLTNNNLLRTDRFYRWTMPGGWVKLLESTDTDFEFRLHNLPSGKLIVLKESLTHAYAFRKIEGRWVTGENITPSILAGSGPDGTGCQAGIDVDYIIDCRTNRNGSCLIVAKDARQHVYIHPPGKGNWSKIDLPKTVSLVSFIDESPNTITLSLEEVGSYGRQAIVDVANKKLTFSPNSPTSVNLTGYTDSIIWVPADDQTLIPCQMRWRIDQVDSLKNTLLKVYGAYGNPYFTGHSEADIAMMNLGFAIVYVHTRGGGIRGPDWYDAGRAENKIRACKDYVAALRFFKKHHPLMTTPLSGQAQSAGGPILGYAVNQYPSLLDAAIFDHAFLDVSGIMQRPELPLTQYEYPEWGNPTNQRIRQLQASYSPFQNIKSQSYPAMLFIGGFYDQSTPYWQIAKFVAALRWANDGAANVLFRTNLRGSHPGTPFGPSQQQLYEQIAFLLKETHVGQSFNPAE